MIGSDSQAVHGPKRGLDGILVPARVAHNHIGFDQCGIRTGFDEVAHGLAEVIGPQLASGLLVPLRPGCLEAQVEGFHSRSDHEFSRFPRDKPGMEAVGSVKPHAAPQILHKGFQGLLRAVEEGVVVEGHVLGAQPCHESQLLRHTGGRTNGECRPMGGNGAVGAAEGAALRQADSPRPKT